MYEAEESKTSWMVGVGERKKVPKTAKALATQIKRMDTRRIPDLGTRWVCRRGKTNLFFIKFGSLNLTKSILSQRISET
jgi:hypothetical protein